MDYHSIYESWRADPEKFWMDAAKNIDWHKKPTFALNHSNAPLYEWYTDSFVNTCFNAVDRHVKNGRADQTAIIYDSPVTEKQLHLTYKDLLEKTSLLAGALINKGITKGDRVIIYMPMVPEAIIAMLACARIGAIHSVVFGGFASNELAVRIDDARPKTILAASCGIEPGRIIEYKPLIDEAIELSEHKPECVVILQRPEAQASLMPGRDFDWEEFQLDAKPADCVMVEGNHPAYILYTSGTTGAPKGVVRPTAGHLVALHWSMKNIYDVDPGDVFWAASDVGWVVGHSYICYAPLIHGNTSVLFEGKPVGTPDAGTFWRVISEHKVKSFFTAPTAFRAIKREDPEGKFKSKYDLSCLKALYLAGERADPDTIYWAQNLLGVPVIDHWWQTETGWSIAGNFPQFGLFEILFGSTGKAAPGFQVNVLNDDGKELAPENMGNLVIKLPLPPGCSSEIWNNKNRFYEAYLKKFDGYYDTSDAGIIDKNGYNVPVFEVRVSKDLILFDQNKDLITQEKQTVSVDGVNGPDIVLGSLSDVSTNGNWPTTFDFERK